jgi:hypothetical protein
LRGQNYSEAPITLGTIFLATALIFLPPLLFEKFTFYLYVVNNPNFFNFSGSRLWFNVVWFAASGVPSALLVGREKKLGILPSLIAPFLFIIATYVAPLCAVKECYVSSTDGLAPVRDFLLLASLGVITSATTVKQWYHPNTRKWIDVFFQLFVISLVGFALTFFNATHIFTGVSLPYSLNYVQWFLAGAPAGLAGSMMLLDRGYFSSLWIKIFAGLSGVTLALLLSVGVLPCLDCSSSFVPTISILLLALLFTLPAIVLGRKIVALKNRNIPTTGFLRKGPGNITTVTIIAAIFLMVIFYFIPGYQASVVNAFPGVQNSSFSPLEVGRTFVYSAGYLDIPRVTPTAVGVNVSLGNTTLNQERFPEDFLAAGIGDQSPNCCTDGLDLAYRADVIEFSNGTEALLARGWWACDDNMACGGYSWQRLLYLGVKDLPGNSLSNWVGLEMNWTSPTIIQWFYRITFSANGTSTPWILYSSYTPPAIQNHYWDAGLFYLGALNPPTGYAYFFQFGVSSAYPITDGSWHVLMQCPEVYLNSTWSCISKAAYINGLHSYWKVIYTFGESYPGTNFFYLGNFEVAFFYSGKSPPDGAPMW